MKKFLTLIFSLYLATLLFAPKEELLYTGLNQLNKQKINFEIEDVSDYGLLANMKEIKLFYDGDKVLNIKDIKVLPLLFFNYIVATNISIAKNYKSMIDIKILQSKITHNIIKPFILNIDAITTIGRFSGNFDIKNKKLKLLLKPNKNFNDFKYKRYFKKSKEGYIYESNIKF